jgi:hypothetical protein
MNDLTKTSSQIILDQINSQFSTNFTLSAISLGTPHWNVDEEFPKNTKLIVSGIGAGFGGSKVIYYDRLPMSQFAFRNSTVLEFSNTPTKQEIVTAFNARFNCNIAVDEIVDFVIPIPNPSGIVAEITAIPGNLVYTGTVAITLKSLD